MPNRQSPPDVTAGRNARSGRVRRNCHKVRRYKYKRGDWRRGRKRPIRLTLCFTPQEYKGLLLWRTHHKHSLADRARLLLIIDALAHLGLCSIETAQAALSKPPLDRRTRRYRDWVRRLEFDGPEYSI